MKKIFFYVLAGLIPSIVFAQMGKPYEMNINGVKVIVYKIIPQIKPV
jgi:hypothetical protein